MGNGFLFLAAWALFAISSRADDVSHPKPDSEEVFTATLQCRASCKVGSQASTSEKFSQTASFDPAGWGLKRGDGLLWGMLGTELWNWGGWVCEKGAESRCGSRERIADVSLLDMKSGNWGMNEAPRCPRADESHSPMVKSPYDETSSLLRLPDTRFDAGVRQMPPLEGHLMGARDKCSAPLRGEFCGGDCVTFGKGTKDCQTLCTDQPLAMRNETVCADRFVSKMIGAKRSGDSASVLTLACESFFYAAVKKESDGGMHHLTGCAAYRGKPDCRQVVRLIQSKGRDSGASPLAPVAPERPDSHSGAACPYCRGEP